MKIRTLKRLWKIHKQKPCFTVSQFGQATATPKIVVSLGSRTGAISLYTYDDTDAGRAQAKLNLNTLSHISGFPVWVQPGLSLD